jgi:hypothetical protein
LWATLTRSGQLLTGRWTYTEKAYIDRGTYFRLKVDVTYRGEPQHFDIVVGCNVLDIGYKDGSGTHEVGLVPTVYGRRMSDGKGLVVRVPDACKAPPTGDYKYPEDFTPLLIVYDSAEKLNFGVAYLSDDAYDSPLSQMRFGKATVQKATRAEFEEFRKNGPPNLISREQYHSVQPPNVVEAMGLKRVWPTFARNCWASERFRLPDEVKPYFAKLRPPGSPRYWGLSVADETPAITLLAGKLLQRDDGGVGRSRGAYMDPGKMPRLGIPKRGVRKPGFSYPAAYYPVSSPLSSDKWSTKPTEASPVFSGPGPVLISELHIEGGKYRGFGYCSDSPAWSMSNKNSEYLEYTPVVHSVDGEQFSLPQHNWRGMVRVFFENDEYIYYPTEMWIDSTRGDV